MDNGGPCEHVSVTCAVEEGDGVVKVAEGGVTALEFEVKDSVVVEVASNESSVDLEKVGFGFGFVD
jgi:hypothetical protein